MAQRELFSFLNNTETGVIPPGFRELLEPSPEQKQRTVCQANIPNLVAEAGKPLTTFSPQELLAIPYGATDLYALAVGAESPLSLAVQRKWQFRHIRSGSRLTPADIKACSFATIPGSFDPSIAPNREDWVTHVYDVYKGAGVGLYLDMVVNHTALEGALEQPQAYVTASMDTSSIWGESQFYFDRTVSVRDQERRIAHGAGEYAGPWGDTAQLNPYSEAGRNVLRGWLNYVGCCDVLRIDMAHLTLFRNFLQRWSSLIDNGEIQVQYQEEVLTWFKREVEKRAQSLRIPPPDYILEAYSNTNERPDKSDLAQLGLSTIYGNDVYDALKDAVHWNAHDNLRTLIGNIVLGGRNQRDLLYIHNHDEEMPKHALGSSSAHVAAATLGLTPGADFMFTRDEFVGKTYRLPQELRRSPIDEGEDSVMKRQYDDFITLRRSKLFQEGRGFMPDHLNLDQGIIATGVWHDERNLGMITCSNLSGQEQQGMIPLGEDAKVVGVYDITTGQWLSQFDSRTRCSYIRLEPNSVQVLFIQNED